MPRSRGARVFLLDTDESSDGRTVAENTLDEAREPDIERDTGGE